MQVNGFQFQGKVYIALDEGSDYYRIYGEKDGTTKEYHHDIAFDELGDVLDLMIETGGMPKEEYQAKVKDFVCNILKINNATWRYNFQSHIWLIGIWIIMVR